MSHGTASDVATSHATDLVTECLDDAALLLGFRPVGQIEWPATGRIATAIVSAVVEAVDASLVETHRRGGATSAIVSVASRHDAIEVCVIDDGRRIHATCGPGNDHFAEPTGVEHGVDDYDCYGTCQWWLIPLDLNADAR